MVARLCLYLGKVCHCTFDLLSASPKPNMMPIQRAAMAGNASTDRHGLVLTQGTAKKKKLRSCSKEDTPKFSFDYFERVSTLLGTRSKSKDTFCQYGLHFPESAQPHRCPVFWLVCLKNGRLPIPGCTCLPGGFTYRPCPNQGDGRPETKAAPPV